MVAVVRGAGWRERAGYLQVDALRVVERGGGLLGWTFWIISQRSMTDPTNGKYFLSNVPATVTLLILA